MKKRRKPAACSEASGSTTDRQNRAVSNDPGFKALIERSRGLYPAATELSEQVVEELKKDPLRPVRTKLGDMTVELRAVPDVPSGRTAASVFASFGPWVGETTEETLALLAAARARGGRRSVGSL